MSIKNYISIVYTFFLLLTTQANGQYIGKVIDANICSGQDGTYLFLINQQEADTQNGLPNIYEKGAFCVVQRSTDGINFKEIGLVQPIKTAKDLDRVFEKKNFLSDLKKAKFWKNKTDDEILTSFSNTKNSFGILTLQPIKLLKSLGLVFVDEDTKKGTNYFYRVERQTMAGDKKVILEGNHVAGTPTKLIYEYGFKVERDKIFALDSLVAASWLVNKPQNRALESVNIYGAEGTKTKFKLLENKRLDKNQDSIIVQFQHPAITGQTWKFFVLPVDYLGNEGNPSDTVSVVCFSKNKLPFLHNIASKDTANGVFISWSPLPRQPFIAGILVSRALTNEFSFSTLDTLTADATEFVDRSAKTGTTYNYELMPLFSPINNIVPGDAIPVRVAGLHTDRKKMLPPNGIQVEQVGEFIKISWQEQNDDNIEKYAVYKGEDATKLTQIGDFVKGQNFKIDSTKYGDLAQFNRFFAVKSIHFNGKSSDYSNLVSIRANQAVPIDAPAQVTLKNINGNVQVEWLDARVLKANVAGYKVFRKNSAEVMYLSLTEKTVLNNQFLDTTITSEGKFEYAVKAVSTFGNESEFSLSNQIEIKKEASTLPSPEECQLRNIPSGIEISWAEVSNSEIQAIKIYKRHSSETELKEITIVPIEKLFFWDKETAENQTYEYAISYVMKNKQESVKSILAEVKREKIEN